MAPSIEVLTEIRDCEHWDGDTRWCDCGLCDGRGGVEVPIRCDSCGDDAHVKTPEGRVLCGFCYHDEMGKDV